MKQDQVAKVLTLMMSLYVSVAIIQQMLIKIYTTGIFLVLTPPFLFWFYKEAYCNGERERETSLASKASLAHKEGRKHARRTD
jgi:hypothetical protein